MYISTCRRILPLLTYIFLGPGPEFSAPSLWSYVNRAGYSLLEMEIAANHTYSMTGVTPQKWPDITYDQTATNVTYTLLIAEITEQ